MEKQVWQNEGFNGQLMGIYICEYGCMSCGRTFKYEKNYKKHKCRRKVLPTKEK